MAVAVKDMDREPTYNLKVVVQETGLKPDTLRVWERRYGLPNPERTPGGHRLYSDRDIAIVNWLLARKQEGMSISRAVALWESLLEEGQDPLQPAVPEAAPRSGQAVLPADASSVVELRQAWIEACMAFDEQRAEQVLIQAFALYPPELVALEVLQKGLAAIGDGWYAGEVTVQQEHFASALAIRRMDALVMASPSPTRPGRILIACPPEEEHVFSPLLITLMLRQRGWDVVYLGARVPRDQLEATLASTRPQLVIMPAQQLHTAASLLEMAQVLMRERIPLAYGGLIFNLLPDLRRRIPGHFLTERLENVPQAVERLMAAPALRVDALPVDEDYHNAAAHFEERKSLIEADLWSVLLPTGMTRAVLTTANNHFGKALAAALALGDMAYLGTDIDWVIGLLSNNDFPAEQLKHYLRVFQQAAQAHLDERGQPIFDWLAQINQGDGLG